jgi:THO complex subunit 2
MKEQERAASEQAEKRLKAALLTKREPGATTSRVASPIVGTSANLDPSAESSGKQTSEEQMTSEDAAMDVDSTSAAANSNSSEVGYLWLTPGGHFLTLRSLVSVASRARGIVR